MLLKLLTQIKHHRIRVKPNKRPQVRFANWQIVKGDQVQIRAGNDKGKIGKVVKVNRKYNTVLVDGVNMKYKRLRSQSDKVVKKLLPTSIHVSNVGLYDSVAKKAVRIKYGFHPQTYQKLRISKKTGIILPKPKFQKTRQVRGKDKKKGDKDTSTDLAHRVTYQGQDFQQVKKEFQAFIAQKQRKQRNLVFTY